MTKINQLVFLIGMPGVGKTFYGKYAANQLGIPFIDLDNEITKTYQLSIAQIFENKGESEFREIEIDTLKRIINERKGDTIIATGGGTPCYNNAMELMNNCGTTVWLDAEIDNIYANITRDNPNRPLFDTLKKDELMNKLTEMKSLRMPFYSKSKVKVSVYGALSPDLFTKRLQLSTFAK